MNFNVVVSPLRVSEKDKPLVFARKVWNEILAMGKACGFDASDMYHISVFNSLLLGRGLTKGLRHLKDPEHQRIAESVIALCNEGRGLHLNFREAW